MVERTPVCKKSSKDGVLTFAFANGHNAQLAMSDLSSEITARLAEHGALQKIGDSYAGSKGDVEEAIDNASAMIERLLAGDWAAEREAAGPAPSMVADAVIAALVAAGKPYDAEKTRAKYTGKDSKEARDKALANPAVKREYEKIKIARAQARLEAITGTADVSDLA